MDYVGCSTRVRKLRRPFTTKQAYENGITRSALEWHVRKGTIQDLGRGVYLMGVEPPAEIERAAGIAVVTQGVACTSFAGSLYGLDSIRLEMPYVWTEKESRLLGTRVRAIESVEMVRGYRCTGPVQTLIDLAVVMNDLEWEQALESALRKSLLTIDDLETEATGKRGVARVRRVLGLRPPGAPATESVLETHAIQLMRLDSTLPVPVRQFDVYNAFDRWQARVDLAFPAHGVFFELDGQQHNGQPVYDANRQTRVVAATGWLVGRFTWAEIVHHPKATLRRIGDLFAMAALKSPA